MSGETPLDNTRWERFAQEICLGKTGPEALEAAGFSTKGQNAFRLKRNELIAARIAWIKANAAENAGITIAGLLAELKKLAYSNVADFVDTTGPEPKVDLKNIPPEKMAAVSEIITRGDEIKIKLWDKPKAIVDLGLVDEHGEMPAEVDQRAALVEQLDLGLAAALALIHAIRAEIASFCFIRDKVAGHAGLGGLYSPRAKYRPYSFAGRHGRFPLTTRRREA